MDKQILHYSSRPFSFRHMVTESPSDIATHIHDCYELFYFNSGDLTYYIEGQAYQLQKHDLIMTNPKELHRVVFNSKATYERKYIHFKPDYVSPYQTEHYNLLSYIEKRKLGHLNLIPAEKVLKHGIKQLWGRIERASMDPTPEGQILMKTYFIQMLVTINKVLASYRNPLADHHKYDQKIVAILEFINQNLDEKITLNVLEQRFYVSKYYLCHIFKQTTGFTVIEYITYKRVMKASELLMSGMTALDVAHAVGFGDYSTFYKAFKKITGLSPKLVINSRT
ncbi:AraC family transcriptional regulator [Amphibacillus cookii]|uniref:AraC family transcriptional regulator n=1 Tax=Amphibacillus cookii TaxID=767787 RepID=UPI001956E408|nr:AraC family transcriptional regulator [Amphibacillus cookii]MBM7541226.1 YesN/AraC family two-component response regulator [Amphibacillus cookii]